MRPSHLEAVIENRCQLITETPRHEALIAFAEFSRDGRWLVTASWDNTARVWEAHSGMPRFREPLKHNAQVLSAHFSSDGRLVVTTSRDKTARVWDAVTGQPVCKALRHAGAVVAAGFSAENGRVVTASEDHTGRIWDVQTGYPVSEPMEHAHFLTSCEFSPDGQKVLTGSLDGTAKVWDMRAPGTLAPVWLAELAEAIGGQRFNSRGIVETVGASEFRRLKNIPLPETRNDFYSAWLDWFFADRSTRTISPFSPVRSGQTAARAKD